MYFHPLFNFKIVSFTYSLWILAINCTMTKNVMKEENEIVKLQLEYKAYSQFTLTKTDEEIL